MYLINTELLVNWLFEASDTPPARADLDILIRPPEGDNTYVPGAITAEDYILPNSVNGGAVTYRFTPNSIGLWIIALTDGLEDDYTFYYEHRLLVSQNDIQVQKFVPGNLL